MADTRMARPEHTLMSTQRTPMPSFMSPDQVSRYLTDLRSYRPPRPSGARPLDGREAHNTTAAKEPQARHPVDHARARPMPRGDHAEGTQRPNPSNRHSIAHLRSAETDSKGETSRRHAAAPMKHQSTSNRHSMTHLRSAATQAGPNTAPADVTSEHQYRIPYYERGQRWMERQEAHSLSKALQAMDEKKDAQVYAAAQREAAQLVWKHQNPEAPYCNPDFDFRQHLRQGSHARSQSIGPFQELHVRRRDSAEVLSSSNRGSRQVSSGSHGSKSSRSSKSSSGSRFGARHSLSGSLRERAMASIPLTMEKVRKYSGRKSGSLGSRKVSDESANAPFSNPEDRIYEEPEEASEPLQAVSDGQNQPLRVKSRNTSYGPLDIKERKKRFEMPSNPQTTRHRVEPPEDVRSPYEQPPLEESRNGSGVRYKNGLEIRSDEIRAATSMRLRDRSPNLPQPSIVSDRPGRPIISFNPDYSLPKADPTKQAHAHPSKTAMHADPVGIPTIQLDNVPSIAITMDDAPAVETPTIAINAPEIPPQRPLPRVSRLPATAAVRGSHWSLGSAPRREQAQCTACALPIQGKVVTAADQRFHPQCFTCYNCAELLECVAFYPEPENARAERLERYADYLEGHGPPGYSGAPEDGDLSLRFFCHLDYHEKFSPRCRNCKTPIEGKVIVACGGEWHEGHFFCAECGDPFDKTTPFIEKDGYAWCVQCHARRFSGKCAGCRKPILETVIQALDREWHEECFCCGECGSQFEDGRFFTRAGYEKPTCVRCEERRLKS